MTRVVIDVNVLVSSVIGPSGHSRQILHAWAAGRFGVIASAGIISNLEDKLSLDRIARRFGPDAEATVEWIQVLLNHQTELILVPARVRRSITGDPEDDYVLATGRLAGADYLVTGDKELLALQEHEGMKIVTPRRLLEIMEHTETGEHAEGSAYVTVK